VQNILNQSRNIVLPIRLNLSLITHHLSLSKGAPLSKIWSIMLISSVATLLFINPSLVLKSMLAGSTASVRLSIELVAMYGFWLGFFAILERTGISNLIAKILSPLIRFLFKGSSKDAQKYISMNMAANLIGLGNAATPMGINAIKALDTGTGKANTNMIMLVVISSTSLQLLPATVISMRLSHGSINATSFLFPCLVATVISTILGVILVKVFSKIFPDEKRARRKGGKAKVALPKLSGQIN
jgi:spore maturation protein A